jgi:ABC-type hemin transport system ATPase subunit
MIVELRDATVVLGGRRILDSLTLSVDAGQHTAILGPNGAGKSTLMKLLALEHYPLALANGTAPVRLFGAERWDVFELRSRLGIVSADLHDRFVHGNSNGPITARDAALSGFFASQGVFGHQSLTAAMHEAAADALDHMGVAHLADVPLDRISTGEARRVIIARALVHVPAARPRLRRAPRVPRRSPPRRTARDHADRRDAPRRGNPAGDRPRDPAARRAHCLRRREDCGAHGGESPSSIRHPARRLH